MSEENQRRPRRRRRLWLAVTAVLILLAFLIVPPLVSISRYKSQITQLLATSLGRPVRLSSVELRLLPRPGFVLTDLTVDDDPAYSFEPVLHANSVTASIRLLSLWRGRLEIGSISVDEASVNLVRIGAGRWNIDPIFRTAAAHAQSAAAAPRKPFRLPGISATSSRVNFKEGVEKLPFSLIDADLDFWQASSGEWRVQFRGRPARTDLTLDLNDTGILRVDATLRPAPQLRQMPIHLDLDWRQAPLGQLNRLLLGSDFGWRGDLRAELSLDGTAESAEVHSRLRATGVHRAEFAPAVPLDFDAKCNFRAHFSARGVENLVCDTPLGGGRIRVAGSLPGTQGPPRISFEVERIPVAAALDALRTLRSGLGQGLEASGTASGKLTWAPAAQTAEQTGPEKPGHPARPHPAPPAPLTGSIVVENLEVSGGALGEPVRAARLAFEPAPPEPGQPQAIVASASIPAGGATPLTVSVRYSFRGYQLNVRGQAAIARARQLALADGLSDASQLESLAGEPMSLDLTLQGPWIPTPRAPFAAPAPSAEAVTGTITLHNANWKSEYLLNHVEIAQGVLHLAPGEMRWDPLVFSYGPVKGTATLSLPLPCDPARHCVPSFTVQFGSLDAAVLQSAFLGAQAPGTVLSKLLERIHPTAAPVWPHLEGTVRADSLVLGPVTLRDPVATLRTEPTGAEITAFDAGLLGGRTHLIGQYEAGATAGAKPSWSLEGQFEKLNPALAAPVIGLRGNGASLDGSVKLHLTGFSGDDLASSATGTLHFDWQKGALTGAAGATPAALARFDLWTGNGETGSGVVTLKQSQAHRGRSAAPIDGSLKLELPARLTFPVPPKPQSRR
ncbi:MAG: AsmA family protein [Terracidiphilus sp.]